MIFRYFRSGLGAWCAVLCLVASALFVDVAPARASGDGPGGINIGFDFNWNNGPAGYTASFIAAVNGSGATLNNCGGPVNSSTSSCDFVFDYSIGGVAQQAVTSGGVYSTLAASGTVRCDTNPANSAPLTLFDCFNSNSFGQVFQASATGSLTAFSMPMTCLNPAGTTLTGLVAVIYQVNPNGISIPATPLAQTPVDLSTCPTLTSWSGHAFSSSDFASIPINFPNVSLTAGNFYAVYFGGLTPGTPVPGGPAGAAARFTFAAPSSSAAGSSLNFTVTALDGGGNTAAGYTGPVHFTSSDGSATLPADATLTNGTGAFSVTLRTTGNQTITASDAVSPTITGTSGAITVAAAGVSIQLTSSTSQSTFGQTVTFAAMLQGAGFAPAGSIQFLDGATVLGTVALNNATTSYSTAALTVGKHVITASYNAGNGSTTVRATVGLTVVGLSTAVTVSAPAYAVYGQNVTLTANVTGSVEAPAGNGPPTGQVTFMLSPTFSSGQPTSLGTVNLVSGRASLSVNSLSTGTNTIVAQYSGDSVWSASSRQTVFAVTAAYSSASVSMSVSGSQLVLSAAVAAVAPSTGTPTGTVQFVNMSNKAVVASGSLSGGKTSVTLAAGATSTLLGARIAAQYSGDNNFWISRSAPLPALVNAADNLSTVFAPDEIASIVGVTGLSGDATVAVPVTAPLAGVAVNVTDSAGATRPAPVYGAFASAGQINFVVPGATAAGLAIVAITTPGAGTVTTVVNVANTAAGIFTASMTGEGPYAGQVIYANPDGDTVMNSALPGSGGAFTPNPISLRGTGVQVYLALYGTGIRHAASVTASINGVSVPVAYTGAQGAVGLDQINLGPLSPGLAGAGLVNLVVTADGQAANTVTVNIE